MRSETKVGLLFIFAIFLIVGFAYSLGVLNPFSNQNDIYIAYNFAGGVEVGSPVRVMGISVGKVKAIEFMPEQKDDTGNEVKLRIKVGIDKSAWKTIRKDSEFYINMAGIIGEKFIEISPGSTDSELLKPNTTVRGEDPPRIDQLISQSYGLAGKILEMVEKNEGSVVETIDMINNLVTNLNKTLKLVNKASKNKDVSKMLKNLAVVTEDAAYLTQKIRSDDGEKAIKILNTLILRLEELDKKAIKKFLQEEGIKAKLF